MHISRGIDGRVSLVNSGLCLDRGIDRKSTAHPVLDPLVMLTKFSSDWVEWPIVKTTRWFLILPIKINLHFRTIER